MWIYKYFKGDDINSLILHMQVVMYSYASSHMFSKVKHAYVGDEKSVLYFNPAHLSKLRAVESYDHRLMQFPHDQLAAVFRYKCMKGEYPKKVFDINSDIQEQMDIQFIDTLFLNKIDKDYWYLTKCWLEFLSNVIEEKHLITKQIAQSVILYNTDRKDIKKAWDASHKSIALIRETFDEVPWKRIYSNTEI